MSVPADRRRAPGSVFRRDVIGWSLYDFANTIYSMNIVSLYLKRYLVEDLHRPDYYFDLPFSLSMLLAAVLLPALGALSDHSTKKKLFVMLFTVSCCLAVGLMRFVPPSLPLVLLLLFVIANFSYEAGQPFYNALLYSVSEGSQARFVSGIGVSLGYVGSILGMLLVLPFVTGDFYGWSVVIIPEGGKAGAFVPTALLFLLFSLPLFAWVKERKATERGSVTFREAYREVWDGVRSTRKYPGVLRFLIADYFFEDAAMTVILNIGVYCSIVLGFAEVEITTFLVISTVAAVVGSLAIGWLSRFVSLKKLIKLVVLGWIIALAAFVITDSRTVVWVLGSMVGVLLGGLWTTTRPFLAELVPREELGRFFGLFALSGRAAAFVGPLLWTAVVFFFQPGRFLAHATEVVFGESASLAADLPYKAAIVSLVSMMVIGLILFRKVPPARKV